MDASNTPATALSRSASSRSWQSRALVLLAAAAGILLAGTVVLWAHYGTAIFQEMILAGIATCF
ncbi:MAG: hypothetical protein J0H17_12825 [Rhizobiales bacterium]|jgi:hypothetical protein|nr:hypothetical protein [Hyphomicrobiales bacterium]